MRRVVITGIAPIIGRVIGKDVFWDMLINKRTQISEVAPEWERNYKYKSRYFVPKPELPKVSSIIDEVSNIAIHSARLAKEDSGLENIANFGIVLGVGIGDLRSSFNSFVSHTSGEGRFNRMVIPMTMPNAAAANIAIDLKIEGFAFTVNTACSSGNTAIGEGYLAIKNGRVDGILAGGIECLDDGAGGIMRAFDVLTTLTTSSDGFPRPFSRNRGGFLMNMGAGCILVLEELDHAKKRDACIYAEIAGYAHNNDRHSIIQMETSGQKIEELFDIAKGLEVNYINAHGTGTLQNDELEAAVIKRVFGEKQPFVNSTKGIIGHSIGASAALEAAVCCLSIKNSAIHGNLTDNQIEGLNLPVDAVESKIDCAINCSYGFGGHNTILVLKRYDD